MLSVYTNAQIFGNEWINTSQDYFKVKLAKDGIYKIKLSDLEAAGMPISSLNLDGIQIFNKGNEIPLKLENGYIYFYGEKNNGDIDTLLWDSGDKSQNTNFSYYTDSASYFITHSNQTGKRFSNVNTSNLSSLPKINFYWNNEQLDFTERWGAGFSGISHPKFSAGEGLMSSVVSRFKAQQKDITFDLIDFYDQNGIDGSIEFRVQGTANQKEYMGFTQHAVLQYYKNKWIDILNEYFNTGEVKDYSVNFNGSFLNNNTLRINLLGSADYETVKNVMHGFFECYYIKIKYPAKFNLNAEYIKKMWIDNASYDRQINLSNPNLSSDYRIFDVKNSLSFSVEKNTTLNLKLPSQSQDHLLVLATEQNIEILEPIKLTGITNSLNTNSAEFLIITSKKLQKSVTEYANYKKTLKGGGFDVELLYVEDLYDKFSYGVHHSVALKNYLKTLKTLPKYAFFIGKGVSVQSLRSNTDQDFLSTDLVPVIGSPASDLYYFTNLVSNQYIADVNVGRLSCTNDYEVLQYLEKLKRYDELGVAQWRKNIIHVSGGKDVEEFSRFKGYLEQMSKIAESPKYGGNTIYYGKDDPKAVSTELTSTIISSINNGASLFSYFGHAGADATEVDLGLPEDYNNTYKPIPMFFGGCVVGNCYTVNQLLGEKFIKENNGAIAWIASSSFSYESYVYAYAREFYNMLSKDQYGESLGKILQSVGDKFLTSVPNESTEAQVLQTIFQGDPTIKLYSESKPDYVINTTDIGLANNNFTAQDDSLTLKIIYNNRGMAIEDSFNLKISLTYPDNSKIDSIIRLPSTYFSDTLNYQIANNKNQFGTFKGTFAIDIDNEIDELSETNNVANFSFFIISNGAASLFPTNYGIVNSNPIELLAQSLDLSSSNNTFQFELDTTSNFNSAFKKKSEDIISTLSGKWVVNLLEKDTQAYYWRVRLKLNNTEYSPWSINTFTYIKNSLSGWAQVERNQQLKNDLKNIYIDNSNSQYKFNQYTSENFSISANGINYPKQNYYTFGGPPASPSYRYIRKNYGLINGAVTYNGMVTYAIDPLEFTPFELPKVVSGIINRSGQYEFNWMETENLIKPNILDSFISYLNQIPEGYHILMYSGYYHRIKDMPERFYKAIEQFGSSEIRKLENDGVWVFIGTKGSKKAVREKVGGPESFFDLNATFALNKSEGSINSTIIGPSKKWRKIELTTHSIDDKTNPTDDFYYSLIGVTHNGNRKTLIERFTSPSLDISFIDANEYPYIQIIVHTKDEINFTPTQLNKWLVYYDNLPEAFLTSDISYKFESDTIERGQTIVVEIGYQNISNQAIKDYKVDFEIVDENRNQKFYAKETLAPLAPGESLIIKKEFSSDDLTNENRLILRTNPNNEQPELYSFNNNFERNIYVQDDYEKPLLDVTFDGYRIMNGDFASPTPLIKISGKDNNKYFPIQDPSMFTVILSSEDDLIGKELDFNSDEVTFYPATKTNPEAYIEYTPNKLEDNKYTLSVQLQDASLNKSGSVSYDIHFEVIGKSTITNFYPYPNPFSTNMRFVFTLTGAQLPDNLLVQIMTISGKIVREIDLSEFGNLKIGNNITEFTWDGTDTYGNSLANGIYLYRVLTTINGQNIEDRNIEGQENFFKGQIGKIYILK